jgi:hypothetical protein
MYGVRELLPSSLEYASARWGRDVDTQDAVLTLAPDWYAGFASDDLRLHVFDGTITAIDDESDDVFVAVVDESGEEREFDRVGPAREYRVGRRMVVRFREAGRTPKGGQIIDVVEVWLG